MDAEKEKELKKLYSEYSDEHILVCLKEEKDSYGEDAFRLLCEEAERRSIKIPEKEESPEVKPEYRKLIEVFTTNKNIEAGFVKSLLDSNNIKSVIRDLYYPSLTLIGSAAVPIKILVEEEDETEARVIIDQYYKDIKK